MEYMNKDYLKSALYGYEVKITGMITDAVLRREGKTVVMRRVRQEIMGIKFLDQLERNQLWTFALDYYRHCIAAAGRRVEPQARADAVYTVLKKDNLTLEKMKNQLADHIEFRKKHSELVDMLSNTSQKFYRCTVLKDCAEDHLPFQGRIYCLKNAEYNAEERAFIKDNHILYVEDVVVNPPYLTTRRNCRHRFIPISFKEAQTGASGSVESFHEISYEEGQYRLYRDRYKMLGKMRKVFGDLEPKGMKNDMKRTRLLSLSWYRASQKA